MYPRWAFALALPHRQKHKKGESGTLTKALGHRLQKKRGKWHADECGQASITNMSEDMSEVVSWRFLAADWESRIDVILRAPDDNEAECPIALAPIASHTLDFMMPEHPSFICWRPELKEMQLPCSHAFSAMALVYHWYANKTMLCPLCRQGPRGAPMLACLNWSWKAKMLQHIVATQGATT